VRDHDERPGVGGQEFFEPRPGFEVEVVGGLVEEEEVGAPEEELRERGAHLPPARELAAVALHVGGPEAEPGEHPLRLGLGVVAAPVVPLLAHGHVALHDGRVLRALGREGGELVLEARAARFQLVQLGEGGERVAAHREAARAEDVLRQVADARAARERDRAPVRLHLARDDAEKRRLAGAVRAGEPDPRAVGHAPGDVVEDDLAPVALGDAGDVEHASREHAGRPGEGQAQLSAR